MTPVLKEKYTQEIVPKLCEMQGYKNKLQAPKITKVTVNMGVGTSVDKDAYKVATEELAKITGQRPVETKARISISNFRLREGMTVGAKVTLRGNLMYEFLDRLINMSLPRIRDFRGVNPKSFDGRGNYSLGVREQTIFPEIDPDKVKRVQGMDITIVTSTDSDEEARELLRQVGMPFSAES